MKTLTTTLGLALAALLTTTALTTTAQAQYSLVGASTTSVNFYDAAYDYDVYAAAPSTGAGWYLLWTYPDGTTELDGPYTSYKSAESWRTWIVLGGYDPRGGYVDPGNYPTGEIFEGPKTPAWQFFQRCDKRATAEGVAEWLRGFGLLVDIRRVSTIKYKLY